MKAALAYLAFAGVAWAEAPEPIASFAECTNAEVVRFERDLERANTPSYAGQADPVDARGVDVCGVGGIILCDRSDAPLPCQHALAAEKEALRQSILASLPEAADVLDGGLYARVHALAKGASAGDDCAGDTPVMEAWCVAREAARRVEMAVFAYQIARARGAARPAFELGWAEAPGPVRPKARVIETE